MVHLAIKHQTAGWNIYVPWTCSRTGENLKLGNDLSLRSSPLAWNASELIYKALFRG